MRILIYPGSFDPMTRGHVDIAERASALCDRLYVAVLGNAAKQPVFDADERVEMARRCLAHIDSIVVERFDGLLVDYMRQRGADAVVRGLRSESDFRFELEMLTANRLLMPGYEAILLPSSSDLALTSSSIVREVAAYGGDLTGMVPDEIRDEVAERLVRPEHRQRLEVQR